MNMNQLKALLIAEECSLNVQRDRDQESNQEESINAVILKAKGISLADSKETIKEKQNYKVPIRGDKHFNRGQHRQSQSKGNITCYACRKTGHMANSCPNSVRVKVGNKFVSVLKEDFESAAKASAAVAPPEVADEPKAKIRHFRVADQHAKLSSLRCVLPRGPRIGPLYRECEITTIAVSSEENKEISKDRKTSNERANIDDKEKTDIAEEIKAKGQNINVARNKICKIEKNEMKARVTVLRGIKRDNRCQLQGHWLLDSGATHHVTDNKELFDALRPIQIPIEVANDNIVRAVGQGNIVLGLGYDNGETRVLTLKSALYAPEIATNIISVPSLDIAGINTHFGSLTATIYQNSDGFIIAQCRMSAGLYHINTSGPRIFRVEAIKGIEWHRRLGHLHANALSKIVEVQEKDKDEINNCEICIQGKMSKLSFPNNPNRAESRELLELIHSDVLSIKPVSIGGSKYVVTFIDDHSRFSFVYCIKRKNDVFPILKEFCALVENICKTNVKIFRSDNGGEYFNKDVTKFLKNKGIIRQLTVPYSPSQNGMAERLNRTLLDKVRCILTESNIPKTFWADAILTANYVRNRSPSRVINYETPFEKFFGRPPDLSNLRTFGCQAWFKIDAEDKLSVVAKSSVFIGYPPGVKGYKLWIPEEKKVVISRSVKFQEDRFPYHREKESKDDNDFSDSWESYSNSDDEEDIRDPLDIQVEENRSNAESTEDIEFEIPVENIETEKTDEQKGECKTRKSNRGKERVDYEKLNNPFKKFKPRVMLATGLRKADNVPLPIDCAEALSSVDSYQWQEAMKREITSLESNNTWQIVTDTNGKTPIKTKWIFKVKSDNKGFVSRFKCRLVAKGFIQRKGVDYDKTFSPVVRSKTIRTLLAIAVLRKWEIHGADFETAFVQSVIQEEVYIVFPTDTPREIFPSDHFAKLKKTLYGLKQAAHEWYETLKYHLISMNYRQSRLDPCIFCKSNIIVAVYVDDLLGITSSRNIFDKLIEELSQNFKLQSRINIDFFLGINVTRDVDNSITIHQNGAIEKLLESYEKKSLRPVNTPLVAGTKIKKSKAEMIRVTEYRSIIGSLLYISGYTRPDIAFSVNYLSQFSHCPSVEAWNGIMHILRYLNKTKEYGLCFRPSGNMKIKCFCDANYAPDKEDPVSTSGYVINLAGAAIIWRSKKQMSIATSTTESEFYAMEEVAKETIWLSCFLIDIGAEEFLDGIPTVYADNLAAISCVENDDTSERLKHIAIKLSALRERVTREDLRFEYIRTNRNLADILTKALSKCQHNNLSGLLGLKKISKSEENKNQKTQQIKGSVGRDFIDF